MASQLIDASEVLEAMGQNPDLMADSLPSIEGAIVRATLKLGSVLRTNLYRESRVDTFVIGAHEVPLNNFYTLFLTNGFISATLPLSVLATLYETGEVVSFNSPVVQYDKGKVLLPSSGVNLAGATVVVSYHSGFAKSSETLVEVKQALLCYVPLMLLSSSASQVDPKQYSVVSSKATSMDSLGGDMVSRYLRNIGNAIKPTHSSLVG